MTDLPLLCSPGVRNVRIILSYRFSIDIFPPTGEYCPGNVSVVLMMNKNGGLMQRQEILIARPSHVPIQGYRLFNLIGLALLGLMVLVGM